MAGFKDFIPPYLAPNTTGPVILKGVSYASGAGGIIDSSGFILVRISYLAQFVKMLDFGHDFFSHSVQLYL